MKIKSGYTFDDLLLIPKYSQISSRNKVRLNVDLGKDIKLQIPIVSANMKSVTETSMAEKMISLGGLALLHRFCDIESQLKIFHNTITNCADNPEPLLHVGCSIGIKQEDKINVDKIVKAGCKIICIDIAHGDHADCNDMVSWIAINHPEILIIAGNVATRSGALRLYDHGADVIKVGIGGGCFAAGTRILMANGIYKNIEEIIPGDRVINKDGNAVNVVKSFSTGEKKIIKLRNNTWYNHTYVTPDHNYWVGDLNSVSKKTLQSRGYARLLASQSKTIPKQSKIRWKSINETQQDCLLLPKNIKFELPEDFSIEISKRKGGNWRTENIYKVDYKLTPSYELGYIFGTFLGDGHAMHAIQKNGSHIGNVSWAFGLNEEEIAIKLNNCVRNIFNKELVIEKKKSIISCYFYYKPFADFLVNFGKRYNKNLPTNLLVNNKDYLKGIYDGLIDSDGHISKDGRISVGNTSSKIIELFNVIHFILNNSFPNNEYRKPSVGGLKNCNIENYHESYIARPLLNEKYRLFDKYQVVKILEKTEIELYVNVYDIEVDCDTHSFIANNAIVHNSLCTTRIETGNGVPQLTALEDVYQASQIVMSENTIVRKFKIIADGGIRRAGDVVKALCYSDAVMLGNLLAGTDETPGEIIQNQDGFRFKEYAGSSTHKTNHVEGVVVRIPYKGPVSPIIENILEGLQSGCSYQGAEDLLELKEDPEFVFITNAGLKESHPHILG